MTKAHSLRTLIVFVSCLLLAGGAFAAEMVGYGDGASWNLDKADFGGILSISGPDGYAAQKAFGAGEAPSFSVWNKNGYALADGQYKWQITLNAAKLERGDAAGEKAASYSGSFRIESGSLVVPKASGIGDSDAFNKDQVISDDLIVIGSACIGVDCSNGESFGFDTLRLKENNLRIKAQDTSSSGSFPTVDWQITFNETSNGGLNKFSVDDVDNGRTPFTIEAGAPTNSLYVEADGDVGFGTNQPVVNLHAVDGNTPTLRLEQNGSSGFTPQTWDLAGNEANFFIRDVTNGSKLPFRIKPGAPDASIYIDSTGEVGINAGTNPDAELHIKNNGAVQLRLENTASGGSAWNLNSASNGNFRAAIANSGLTQLESRANGDLAIAGTCVEFDANGTPFSCVFASTGVTCSTSACS